MDSEDVFNISELENKKPLYDLASIVHDKHPEYSHIVDAALNNEDVKTKDLQTIISVLTKELVPYYDAKGNLSDPEMEHIHEAAVALGRQL